MNKIGLRIYRFKDGPSITLDINDGDWTKKVVDIRDVLKLYDSKDTIKFAMLMSFSKNGTYITIARSISGRGGDNIAAWIYIPNKIQVTGVQVVNIIKTVKLELSAPKINSALLADVFAKEYPTMVAADYMPSSLGNTFAKRDASCCTLEEILGETRYQPGYSKFHYVLINDNDSMEILDKNVEDITCENLVQTFVLCPPHKQDVPDGVTVHFNGSGFPEFDKPIRACALESIDLIYKRFDFEDIPHRETVKENEQRCVVPALNWKKSISKDSFKVSALHDTNIDLSEKARVSINNMILEWNQPLSLTEEEAVQANVRISANGYETLERQFDLVNAKIPVTVSLHRAVHRQSWTIELDNGKPSEMVLASKYLVGEQNKSPIKGYTCVKGVLRYSVIKQRVIGFLMAVAIFCFLWLGIAFFEWSVTHILEFRLSWPPIKIEKLESSKPPLTVNGGQYDLPQPLYTDRGNALEQV